MKDHTMDVLLRMGTPARVRGMAYICDAMELFESDPYYVDGKIGPLYEEIAKRHHTTASSVERAIRHAFETTLEKGDPEVLDQYLDVTNTQNSNLLRSLYFRIRRDDPHPHSHPHELYAGCSLETCAMKDQLYQEALNVVCRELASMLSKQLPTM